MTITRTLSRISLAFGVLFIGSAFSRAEQCQITSPLPIPITIQGCNYTSALPPGSTNYIQNTLSPTTTSQMFSVQAATITQQESLAYVGGTQCLHSVNGAVSGTGADCGSGSGGVTVYPASATAMFPFGIDISSNIEITHGAGGTNVLIQTPGPNTLYVGMNQSLIAGGDLFNTFFNAGVTQGAVGGFTCGFGPGSCANVQGGSEDSCFGVGAGGGTVNGSFGVFFGPNADPSNVNGNDITAIGGINTCYFNTVDNTTCIGAFAGTAGSFGGTSQSTGTGNIFIGPRTGFTATAGQLNNVVAIGMGVQVSTNNTVQVGDSDGQAFGAHVQIIVDTITVHAMLSSGNIFANLGTPPNGTFEYCSDCTVTTPATCTANLLASCVCAGSGTGAFAKRLNGTWYCN